MSKSNALSFRKFSRQPISRPPETARTCLAASSALVHIPGGTGPRNHGALERTWRKAKSDWDAWNAHSLADEPIVRLILDGTMVRVRLDRKATFVSLLVLIGLRADGQKVLLAIKSMGGESAEASVTPGSVQKCKYSPMILPYLLCKSASHMAI